MKNKKKKMFKTTFKIWLNMLFKNPSLHKMTP